MKKNLFLLTLLLCSCSSELMVNRNPKTNVAQDSTMITMDDYITKEINVGDIITNRPVCSQMAEIEGKEKYMLLDMNKMYVFDWQTGMLEDSVDFHNCGKITNLSGFAYRNKDSIMVYNYSTKRMYCVNNDGKIIGEWKIPRSDDSSSEYVAAEAINGTNIICLNGASVVSGPIFGNLQDSPDNKERASLLFSVNETDKKGWMRFPDIYYQANWGGTYMNSVSHCKVDSVSWAYSFPIEHYIHKYSLSFSNGDSIYMGSRYIDEIVETDINFVEMILDRKLRDKYYVSQHSYGPIIYDNYHELFIRVAEHPIKQWNGDVPFFKPFSLIIMSKDGKMLSETSIRENSDKLCFGDMYGCKEGLAIRKMTENENVISFNIYKIKGQ